MNRWIKTVPKDNGSMLVKEFLAACICVAVYFGLIGLTLWTIAERI